MGVTHELLRIHKALSTPPPVLLWPAHVPIEDGVETEGSESGLRLLKRT